jgi:hypothetical protein
LNNTESIIIKNKRYKSIIIKKEDYDYIISLKFESQNTIVSKIYKILEYIKYSKIDYYAQRLSLDYLEAISILEKHFECKKTHSKDYIKLDLAIEKIQNIILETGNVNEFIISDILRSCEENIIRLRKNFEGDSDVHV